jgi:hypothetical protein
MALTYRKALDLRLIDVGASGHGNVVNLMSNDAQKFFDLMTVLHLLWAAPMQIVLAAIFLILLLSWYVRAAVRVRLRACTLACRAHPPTGPPTRPPVYPNPPLTGS